MLTGMLDLLPRLPAFQVLLASTPGATNSTPHGVMSAAHPFIAAGLYRHREANGRGPLILLTARSEMAQKLAAQLSQWLPPLEDGGPPILVFAEPDALPYERIRWNSATRQQRLTTLAGLQSRTQTPPIVISSARALAQKTLPARELRMALRPISVGDFVRLDQMTQSWVQTGYNPVDIVEEPGAFARRGGIVDIWPPNLPNPIRIDLFGDEVESLRVFDPATQRTLHRINATQIGPGSEALSKFGPAALERLNVRGGSLSDPQNLDGSAASPLLDPRLLLAVREEVRLEVDHLSQGHSFHGIEWYLPYFYTQPATLLDYLPANATLVVDDAVDLVAALYDLEEQAAALHVELVRSGDLPEAFLPSCLPAAELSARVEAAQPTILGYGTLQGKDTSSHSDLARSFVPGPRYGGKVKQIAGDVAKHRRDGAALVLVTRQAARIQATLQEADIIAHVQSDLDHTPVPAGVTLVQGVLAEGFVLRGLDHDAGDFDLYCLTDTELFGWSKPRPGGSQRRSPRHSTVAPELFFADVKPGDYVVHLEHGVGIFDGLVTLELGGLAREYLQVSYARSDKLYVPVHQAERLSRYVGAGEATPIVSRLGTADWQLVKDRARRAVADIADELLQLYAERELVAGYAYSPDGPWHEELAASFAYEETDDQLDAIEEVTRDMEAAQPMDRLICGDVGYGKTEVAVRAAFKAITDGKQVAMLVPTTVLAQQHYRTLSARLNRFPVRVEMLSRFRTPAQQEQIVKGLAVGSVDLVVGTHRLLSRDLDFKDLGLLIIDEEQRFGVVQKEKLKQLRTQIDVLTLSATPIPRTLHMSLSGVRDMSAITTPPKERLPVHTVLSEYDDTLVRQAIERELSRNGQVFIVHHRVRNIEHLADRIRHLVPEARVVVGHGQMPERTLEDVMLQFAEGEYDVLVATTIIENGLDIPNANTMIINRADHFGLAQLYQLRGRVGRGAARGHCYLLYDKHSVLTYDARRRLSAIMESSEELGAGFRIAMRDLEIRGAGDLLGARQHGHIDSVGFDLYTRLLAQAINEARRKKQRFDQAVQPQSGETEQPTAEIASEIAAQPSDEASSQGSLTDLEGPFDLADPLAPPVLLDLPIEAKIPESYIAEEAIRLQMYRRIAGMTHLKSIDEMRKELLDRFGPGPEDDALPEEVENLFFLIRVKILALKAGVQNIGRELDQLVIRSEALENMNRPAMQSRVRQAFGAPGDGLPEDAFPRVARRALYLPLDEAEAWRTALTRTLEIMAHT